ncbi:prevent-host-death family protein [Actinoalloteichus fjordicus]|uniref:Prevent-host-death family protein n=2 Tax=Actinoalloteichus fjordicus TaxID=1612552 RepID=A0AAC9L993_9PSEU|nr:prevent-host-death family protein [Actinoalloteichus fjordicus]
MYYHVVMAEIPVRTLNQDTAGVLARVKRGEALDVTERGTVIARIVPALASRYEDLLALGRLRAPRLAGPIPLPPGPVQGDFEAGELIGSLRDEERY